MEFNILWIGAIAFIGMMGWASISIIIDKKKADKRRIIAENNRRLEEEARLYNALLDCEVRDRSKAIKEAYDINTQFNFIGLQDKYEYYVDLNTLQKFKTFDKEKYMLNILKDDNSFDRDIKAIDKNKENWKSYVDKYNNIELLSITEFKNFVIENNGKETEIDYNTYHAREYSILKNMEYKKPVTEINIVIVYQYRSPGGRKFYKDVAYINHDTFMKLYDKTKTKKSFAYEQRKLMTNSLRYDVMKRDNFKCVLCGRGASDGVTLEVDHIIPVSKGGLTELDNLRTLCYDCNRGKSDKIE